MNSRKGGPIKLAALELVDMRDSVPAIAKTKISKVTTMAEAWKYLDLEYHNLQEDWAKLKEQVRGLKVKATLDPLKIL